MAWAFVAVALWVYGVGAIEWSKSEYPLPTHCDVTEMQEVDRLISEEMLKAEPNPLHFRNHMYSCESGETVAMRQRRLADPHKGRPYRINRTVDSSHCAQYEINPRWRPDPKHYPWSPSVLKGSGGTKEVPARREVLYGTAFAQKAIYESQHPKSCRDAKFLVYRHGTWPGMGSHVHIAGQALALAMELGRVLVWDPDHTKFPFRDSKRCNGIFTWDCWWRPVTSCPTPSPNADVLFKENIDDLNVHVDTPFTAFPGVHYDSWTHRVLSGKAFGWRSVPTQFEELLECSPIKATHRSYWWRAQASAYLFRFNDATRRELDAFKTSTLVMSPPKTSGTEESGELVVADGASTANLPPGTFGAFIRLSREKQMEIRSGKGARHFESMAENIIRLQQGFQVEVINSHIAEFANRTSQFRDHEMARQVFISADSNKALDEALKEKLSGRAMSDWTYYWTRHARSDIGVGRMLAELGETLTMMISYANLELMLEVDGLVCALSSNWCRLIDELRVTVGGRANSPFVELSAGVNRGLTSCGNPAELNMPLAKRNRHCYLGRP